MSVGGEIVRTIPLQRVFVARKSHDKDGTRIIPLLAAGATYDSGIIQVSGNTDLEIFNQSDVAGTVYIFLGVNPISLVLEAVGAETVKSVYNLVNFGATYVQRCAAEYARVLYVNGDVEQDEWEFSIQFRPIGR